MRRFFALMKKIFLAGSCCELPAVSFQGEGVFIPHMNGIVVNPEARIGSNCTVFQQVTIGSFGVFDKSGSPDIGNGVLIGAGAKVLGPVKIGDGARIGANAVVTKDVPAGATVVGANKIVRKREEEV